MDNKDIWKTALDINEVENDDSVKAIYENSFCMDNHCVNYFEDMCAIALAETGEEINPLIDKERDSKDCKGFRAGTFLAYEVDLTEEDFKGEK